MNSPKYFTFAELTGTSTKLANTPETWEQVSNLQAVGLFLDMIREQFGMAIRVNCAYRSQAVNKAVGGVATSAHLKGLAADVCAYSGKEEDNRALLALLEKNLAGKATFIDQLISYHKTAGKAETPIRFIHVGLAHEHARAQRLYK